MTQAPITICPGCEDATLAHHYIEDVCESPLALKEATMRGHAPMPITHHGQRGTVRVYETTRYELIAERGTERHLITYSARKTQRVMVESIWNHRDALLALFGLTAEAQNTIHGKGDRLTFGFPGGWTIRWSGRTEREAVQSGEYRSI